MPRSSPWLVAAVLAVASLPVPLVVAAQAPPIPMRPTRAIGAEVDGAALSVTFEYPFLSGEKIFGGSVPFDSIWCPGRGRCARFSTDHALQFAGLRLPAGEYSLWMMPSEKGTWTLTFNTNSRSANQSRHNPALDVGRTELQRETLPSTVEQLTFTIQPASGGSGGVMAMEWENTRVSVPFKVIR